LRLRLGGVAAESFSCCGKAKPFRKDSGKAAPKHLFKKQEAVYLFAAFNMETQRQEKAGNAIHVARHV
jgi:hypothetical protein